MNSTGRVPTVLRKIRNRKKMGVSHQILDKGLRYKIKSVPVPYLIYVGLLMVLQFFFRSSCDIEKFFKKMLLLKRLLTTVSKFFF